MGTFCSKNVCMLLQCFSLHSIWTIYFCHQSTLSYSYWIYVPQYYVVPYCVSSFWNTSNNMHGFFNPKKASGVFIWKMAVAPSVWKPCADSYKCFTRIFSSGTYLGHPINPSCNYGLYVPWCILVLYFVCHIYTFLMTCPHFPAGKYQQHFLFLSGCAIFCLKVCA